VEKKSRGRKVLIVLIILFVLFFILAYTVVFMLLFGRGMKGISWGGEKVALIRIEGTISADRNQGGVNPEDVIDQLKQAEEDDGVKAILLRINSPGGTAAASQEIYQELKRAKKPVVASIGDIGASGAYWIACGADEIMASPASDVGSIGVIMAIPNLAELFKKVGIKYIVITKGKYKDIGNPARPLTKEERKILSKQAGLVYEQFIEAVAESRKLSREEVEKLASGLAFLGEEAKEMGLIDELGNFRDAVKLAGKRGKIEGEPQLVEYAPPSIFEDLSSLLLKMSQPGLDDLLRLLSSPRAIE
jgi:protease-4